MITSEMIEKAKFDMLNEGVEMFNSSTFVKLDLCWTLLMYIESYERCGCSRECIIDMIKEQIWWTADCACNLAHGKGIVEYYGQGESDHN